MLASAAANVVEIVDVSSSNFHRVPPGRFSKLLNLKMHEKGAHLRPSWLPRL